MCVLHILYSRADVFKYIEPKIRYDTNWCDWERDVQNGRRRQSTNENAEERTKLYTQSVCIELRWYVFVMICVALLFQFEKKKIVCGCICVRVSPCNCGQMPSAYNHLKISFVWSFFQRTFSLHFSDYTLMIAIHTPQSRPESLFSPWNTRKRTRNFNLIWP